MYIIKEFVCFILYCFPVFVGRVYLSYTKKIQKLFFNFKWIGLIVLPFFISCSVQFIAMKFTEEYTDQFGGIVYLSISYAALIIPCFCLGS